MPRPRYRKPDTVRLELTDGDWLLVKKRLTTGEQRTMFARMVKTMRSGEKPDLLPETVGVAQVAIYLVDWSILDADEKPVVVRGKSFDDVMKILQGLDPEDFAEIAEAIDAHEAAMLAEREQEKKVFSGENAP